NADTAQNGSGVAGAISCFFWPIYCPNLAGQMLLSQSGIREPENKYRATEIRYFVVGDVVQLKPIQGGANCDHAARTTGAYSRCRLSFVFADRRKRSPTQPRLGVRQISSLLPRPRPNRSLACLCLCSR